MIFMLQNFFKFLIIIEFIFIGIILSFFLFLILIVKNLNDITYSIIFNEFVNYIDWDRLIYFLGCFYSRTPFLEEFMELRKIFHIQYNIYNTNFLQLNNINNNDILSYDLYFSYYNIIYFIILCTIIAIIFFFLSYLFFIKPIKYNEKLLPYECGFNPFDDARKEFNIHFYLIAIFFIVFDIESVFIFPWVVSFYQLDNFGFFNMIDFLVELLIGYFYIISTNSLNWSK